MSRNGALALVLASLAAVPAYAQTCVNAYASNNYGSTISFVTSDPHVLTSQIDDAITRWQTCWQQGLFFPTLVQGGSAEISIDVAFTTGSSGWFECATFTPLLDPVNLNQIVGGTIVLFDADGSGRDCEPYRVTLIAHEIGHAFGLDESPCSGDLMGLIQSVDTLPALDECAKVDAIWYTNDEAIADRLMGCYTECRGTCDDDGNCTDAMPSPIIIDIAGRGYHLTNAASGVRFDLDADGFMEDVAWTSAGDAGNAFLCVDVNGNGAIDSGSELFGNYSVLPDGSRAANGFAALAAYDTRRFGGNENGWVDPGDAIWQQLRLWVDMNHDGISQPNELMTLDAAGIVRISTRYDTERRRDQFGNVFRYRGTCLVLDGEGKAVYRNLYDVFLRAR